MFIIMRIAIKQRLNIRRYSVMNVNEYFQNKEVQSTYRQVKKKWENKVDSKCLIASEEWRREFLVEYPAIVKYILEDEAYSDVPDFSERTEDILNYLIHSRLNRGVLATIAFKEIQEINSTRTYSNEDYKICQMAAWAMEMIETYTVIHDDLFDEHMERRGMISWYRLMGHGKTTTNDCFFIKFLAYKILQRYCKSHPAYLRLIELLQLVDHHVQLGQVAVFVKDLARFNVEFYNNLTRHKTDYFLYYHPIMLGTLSAYITDEELLKELTELTLDIGRVYQLENDVNDVFGRKNVIGQSCNDIQKGNCSWLIVTAFKLANKNQRRILFENYGKANTDAEKRVIDIYYALNLNTMYKTCRQERNAELQDRIKNASTGLPKKAFVMALNHGSTVFELLL